MLRYIKKPHKIRKQKQNITRYETKSKKANNHISSDLIKSREWQHAGIREHDDCNSEIKFAVVLLLPEWKRAEQSASPLGLRSLLDCSGSDASETENEVKVKLSG